jgi:Bacterial Ig-like domain (group 3)
MRRRKLPLLAALAAGIVTLVVASVALATTTFDLNGTYTPLGGTTLHQHPPISNTSLTPDCTSAELASLPPGGVLWHFVLTQTTDLNTGVLRADFQSAGLTVPDVDYSALNGGNPQWNVITPTADTLLNASTDAVGDQLNLSHVCYVAKASPSIVTDPGVSGKTGDTLNDTATLSGGNSPTGTITFNLYAPGDDNCDGPALYTQDVTVNDNGDYSTSPGYVALVKGTYNWTADYSGDSANFPASSGCGEEALVVEAAAPTVLTEIHLGKSAEETGTPTVVGGNTHVDLGSFVHDSATASGGPSTPEGTIDFKFYSTIDCTPVDGGSAAGTVPLVSGVAHPSSDEGALAAGSYSFKAFYTSSNTDKWQNSESLCEPLTVDQGTTNSATEIHFSDESLVLGAVDLGSTVHDQATVTGSSAAFMPTGSVVFTFYSGGDCETGTAVGAGTVALDANGVAHPSDSEGPLHAGSYAFSATYAGDGNYAGSLSDCEPLTVNQGTTGTSTEIHFSDESLVNGTVIPGSTVHDKATVTGSPAAFALTGNVTFTFYTGGDCTTGTPAPAGTVALDANGVAHPSDSQGPLAGGSYAFQATYAGDSDYQGSTSPCEPLSVRTFGKTMGFWGNTNGQALLAANHAFTTPLFDKQFAAGYAVTIGEKNGGCYIVVDSAAKSKTILPNQLNGASLIPQCDTTAERDTGINLGSFNTLLAQTLALSYNILYKAGFASQTIGSMGLTAYLPTVFASGTPLAPLTASSTVEQVRQYANYLISRAKSSDGVTITQTMIGQLNTLLGQMNAEA